MKKSDVRLSADVIPNRYELHLTPDLKKFTFEGDESIHLTLKKPTSSITLHSIELEISSAQAISKKDHFPARKISYDKKRETTTIVFKKPLPAGALRLDLAFSGTLNDKMHGFYRSSYQVGADTKYLATTQFEATDARRTFPCFDEPALKATFDVSLTTPAHMTAISNTVPIEEIKTDDGRKTVHFAPTPRMSTYLLAFIVGELEHVERKSNDGVLVRVFTTPGKKKLANFALDCAAKTIAFFNTYFDIPYPMPVLDLIAIPDFAAGAMENWGAITYRESALLIDEKQSSSATKQWVALVIAHEIAHQWFGNLVTMEWWTHLWLNEGFASYIEYLAVDHIFPEWDIWTQFLDSDFGRALQADGLKHTHAIEVEVRDPAEISEVFDAVSYSKGASVIRMLAEYLGERNFRDGLRHYLKKHAYGNAETADLWKALEKISGKPVGKLMRNWTEKPGYPLLSIHDRGDSYELRQTRFFGSPLSQKDSADKTLWQMPLSFASGKSPLQPALLLTRPSVKIPKRNNSWLKANADETAFYRTSYPEELRRLLGEAIRDGRLKVRDRLGLARDTFALTETGKITSAQALAFAENFVGESEYVVWAELAGGIGKIRSLIAHEPYLAQFDSFALAQLSDIRKKIAWNTKPKNHSQALLKMLILESLGRYGDPSTTHNAQKLFRSISSSKNPIPADLRSVVYNTLARRGGKSEYTKLAGLYKVSPLHEEKNRIGRALGLFQQEDLLKKTLQFALSKHVRPQDSVRMISVVAMNPKGRDLAWRFIVGNWKELSRRYAGSRELAYLFESFSGSTSLAWLKEFQNFLKSHPAPGTERTVRQIIERVKSNAAWLGRDRKLLGEFLKGRAA